MNNVGKRQGPPLKALLAGYYGARNMGDELMLGLLREWLGDQGIAVDVLAEAPGTPYASSENVPLVGQWGFANAWLRGKAWRVLRKIRECDIVIGGGGDCIRDDVAGWKQFTYSIEKYIVALLLGKQIALLNVGLRPLRSSNSHRLLKWVLNRSSLTVVRDAASFRFGRALGAANLQYAPDIVLRMPLYFPGSPEESPRPYALVCLRQTEEYGMASLSDGAVRAIAGSLDRFVSDHDTDIVFVPCQTFDSSLDDNILHRKIFDCMHRKERARMASWIDDRQEIATLFRNCRFVFAMRLHAAVLAVAYGKPCLAISYDRKVEQFCQQSGISYLPDTEALSSADLITDSLNRSLGGALRVNPELPAATWDSISLRDAMSHAKRCNRPQSWTRKYLDPSETAP